MVRMIAGMALILLAANASAAGYSEDTDRFTGRKTISWTSAPSYGALAPNLFIHVEDGKAENGMVFLSGSFKTWRYLRCSTTHWLADGARLPVVEQDHNGSTGGDGVIEHISNLFGVAELKKIAAASTVEYKACNDEFRFTQDQLDGFKKAIGNAVR